MVLFSRVPLTSGRVGGTVCRRKKRFFFAPNFSSLFFIDCASIGIINLSSFSGRVFFSLLPNVGGVLLPEQRKNILFSRRVPVSELASPEKESFSSRIGWNRATLFSLLPPFPRRRSPFPPFPDENRRTRCRNRGPFSRSEFFFSLRVPLPSPHSSGIQLFYENLFRSMVIFLTAKG